MVDMEMICIRQECYGCSACYNICPQNCISMVPDEEGFLYPVIDQEKCIDCRACISVCQAHNSVTREPYKQKYFAAKNTNSIRAVSSSGGMFTAISDYVIANNGVVVGAVLDTNFNVIHKIAYDVDGRNELRGTKYVQSNLKRVFSDIKSLLEKGKQTMFVGTPCQVEGLNLFLKNRYDNLITCDLVCHGAASPKVFESFIEYIQEKTKSEVEKFNFRDKDLGWRGYRVSAEYKNMKVKNTLWLRSFNYLFSKNYINRPSCAQCKYVSYNRCSDITLGDYWGVEKFYPLFEDRFGISLIMINTQKGEKLYKSIKKNLIQIEIKKEEAKQNSLCRLPKPNKRRDAFWVAYNRYSYNVAIKKYGECNIKGYIKNIIREIVDKPIFIRFVHKYVKNR